ncbi:MAG: His/Gly/Thr/Pro-type tRNA ligase C-terminal domain-containing protein [Pygmaiobacter massiliensis]|nr:His/Gly/Thr/Pro-type tRNA ligase C-terminal domain-containing protein [Pygmaiobacter massiliensis]
MKYANKLGAEYTAVIGETELAEGKGKLKRMSDGIETEVAYAELESALL